LVTLLAKRIVGRLQSFFLQIDIAKIGGGDRTFAVGDVNGLDTAASKVLFEKKQTSLIAGTPACVCSVVDYAKTIPD
jgi:hypothetical protein